MATIDDVINLAITQLGYKEEPPGSNHTKYGKWFGLDPAAWCSMFQLWLRAQLALFWQIHNGASVGFVRQYCEQQGWMRSEPERGCWVFFEWENDNWPDHIGLVESVNADGTINTIEGNSAGPDHTDEVARHLRTRRNAKWFAMPSYDNAVVPQPEPIPTPIPAPVPPIQPVPAPVATKTNWGPMNHPQLQQGSKGQAVIHLQAQIGVQADGQFGPHTKQAVINLQHSSGIQADGVVGPITWSHLHHQIQLGANEPAVGECQRCLNLNADNQFGPITDSNFRSFQQQSGQATDGQVGPNTWRALLN